ncbi:AAA family ATPase [Candidatus Nitronereus thalassa]|uniref:AAA family ATPase n=1 Tax=Candidatus Nitronereus thalassa TaxID=3020898 RepID=A0ABU3K9C8_9BACT|nr:AAA family ATPase [Candidatus Nitronereus thalassa]MDT7042993.1 AAA family ATPase [Candidatus Nitronereus thalassa]
MNATLEHSRTLIQALMDPSVYPHPVTKIEVLETHISWVLLTGPFAYKIKKPVNLGFVDFSTLPLRHHACKEELRLNGRMAPQLYLDIIPISGTPEAPTLGDGTAPIEYAVKMRQFPLDATLDHALPKGKVQNRHLDQLAKDLAKFHGGLLGAKEPANFGNSEVIKQTITDVFDHFSPEALPEKEYALLHALQQWMEQEHAARYETFTDRKRQGFVRECHGDLHLANVVLIEDMATPFDGIEFSERLRWIDVISDASFFIMDLRARGRSDFAWRFLNAYLEHSGDYAGISVLRFYEVYRALVRTKVARIRLDQSHQSDESSKQLMEEFHRYIHAAQTLAFPSRPSLMIMHGLSGSGKSTYSQSLLETIGAIRLRSDIERKRMVGLTPNMESTPELKPKLYGPDTTKRLYIQLRDAAQRLLASDYSVIVDATFLQRQYRDLLRTLAEEVNVPFFIIDVQAPPETLRERIVTRAQQHSDASEADLAVLQQQKRQQEPLGDDELRMTYSINSEESFDPQPIIQALQARRE